MLETFCFYAFHHIGGGTSEFEHGNKQIKYTRMKRKKKKNDKKNSSIPKFPIPFFTCQSFSVFIKFQRWIFSTAEPIQMWWRKPCLPNNSIDIVGWRMLGRENELNEHVSKAKNLLFHFQISVRACDVVHVVSSLWHRVKRFECHTCISGIPFISIYYWQIKKFTLQSFYR